MPVDIDIAHVARLARLDLSPEELESYRSQLSVILEHAARVQSLQLDPFPGNPHPLGLENVYRDDEARPGLDRDEVLSQAPEARDGFFVAPPALDTE
jgi:aspartyl-tRNA(Asn)/glutamyl-tRNA(Gln) amidotransferase subunit C